MDGEKLNRGLSGATAHLSGQAPVMTVAIVLIVLAILLAPYIAASWQRSSARVPKIVLL